MSIVLDYTARIAPSHLRAADVVGVCRYLKPDNATRYRITHDEYKELVNAGIDVTLNWEYDELDWLGGSARGTNHGKQAVAQAKALGYPTGRVIVGSADFDMSHSQWQSGGEAYARAFAAEIRAGGYRPGVYGPWDVLQWVKDAGIMDAFWQAGMSTAWSGKRNRSPWPGAHLRQRGHRTVGGQDTDWNEILIPNWGEDDMYTDEDRLRDQQTHAIARAMRWMWQTDRDGYLEAQGAAEVWDYAGGMGDNLQAEQLTQLLGAATAQQARDDALAAAVKALANLGGTGTDPQAVFDAIERAVEEAMKPLQAQIVDLQTRLAHALAASAKELNQTSP